MEKERHLTEFETEMIYTMKDLNLSLETIQMVLNHLEKQEDQQEMMDYIIHYKDIITDHQTIQHLNKMVGRIKQR